MTFEGDPSVDWMLLDISASDWHEVDPDDPIVSGDTLAVINLGPPDLVATDALAPASFTLTLTHPEGETRPCGCAGAGGGAGMSWVAALLALVARTARR